MVNAGQINAGVAILPYPKGDRATADAIAHNDVVELYYVLLGEATMNTGGTIHHVHRVCGDSAAAQVADLSRSGKVSGNIVSRKIGPGDVTTRKQWEVGPL
jgi:hypothetical protein